MDALLVTTSYSVNEDHLDGGLFLNPNESASLF
jgi:hypothetical protein